MGKDNTERYDRFSKAYKTAYFDMSSAEDRKKKMDAEWREKWKNSDDMDAFETRLIELKFKRDSKAIFSEFSHSKKKKIKLNSGASMVESQSSSTTVHLPEQVWDADALHVRQTSPSSVLTINQSHRNPMSKTQEKHCTTDLLRKKWRKKSLSSTRRYTPWRR